MWLRPDAPADCDGANNYRVLIEKGSFANGSYSLVLEENQSFQARVTAGGQERALWSQGTIPVGQWSKVGFTYSAATGEMEFFINGEKTASQSFPPAPLTGDNSPLHIGGPGGTPTHLPGWARCVSGSD